ncbi:hypothetical protein TCEL_02029 [Thermobrachium celere DSM 8682]|uniref:Uncharacterized protein n=1 Tax=Thermobrachium celere DSM 8682 TaxID=941824 RepID=R7RU66_9CLOT|nr:hypothetical protein TCEL_02029 [Thermobrachium celere DSM 8682]
MDICAHVNPPVLDKFFVTISIVEFILTELFTDRDSKISC